MGKFRQSKKDYTEQEQFYYDATRQMAKDNGIASISDFIKNGIPLIIDSSLVITKERFLEILNDAYNDYFDLLFIDRSQGLPGKEWLTERHF